ncbi:MAG: MBL fold metallo-hydrolase [Lentisphaeria bacterium]|nr:MBL fold metallo-hydrolase [Lentisphaeria bacterium]
MNPIIQKLLSISPVFRSIAICRLGQHSFLVKADGIIIAFDPYLTADNNRLIASLISPDDFCNIDVICCSHDHGDHIDRQALKAMAQASPNAVFIVPEAVKNSISEISSERMIGMNDEETVSVGNIQIKAIAAAHEMLDQTAEGLYPYLGYIVSVNGVSIYHSGDCCVYEGLLSKLKKSIPDIMLLPINGRDAVRLKNNCIGNMTYQEAADLAGWCGTSMVIPAHYDMFHGNLENPELFMDYMAVKYPMVRSKIMHPGEIYEIIF